MERQAGTAERAERHDGYDTDLTDAEWALFENTWLAERTSTRGRKPKAPRRTMINAILYRLRTGCQWRNLPRDFPRWDRVYRLYRRWVVTGLWERIHDSLCRDVRKKMVETSSRPPLLLIRSR